MPELTVPAFSIRGCRIIQAGMIAMPVTAISN